MAEEVTQVEAEPAPVEGPGTELGTIIQDNPLEMVETLEKTASLAPRMIAARNKILTACTFPNDWEVFGTGDKATACLSSAGAERVGVHFGIKIFDVSHKKESWDDEAGKAYRYTFEGKATLGSRIIYCTGSYSTRDPFLGKKGGEFKDIKEINENHIRNAAYHIFQGNCIKVMLGLRNFPVGEYQKIMASTGQAASKTTGHGYANGSQGGTSSEDTNKQIELGTLILDMANANYGFAIDEEGKHSIIEFPFAGDDPLRAAIQSCKALTSFWSKKDEKVVDGLDSAKKVKGTRLEIALDRAKKMWKEVSNGA